MTFHVDGGGGEKHINYEPSLPGKPAPHANRQGATYTDGQSEQGGAGQKEPATTGEVAAK